MTKAKLALILTPFTLVLLAAATPAAFADVAQTSVNGYDNFGGALCWSGSGCQDQGIVTDLGTLNSGGVATSTINVQLEIQDPGIGISQYLYVDISDLGSGNVINNYNNWSGRTATDNFVGYLNYTSTTTDPQLVTITLTDVDGSVNLDNGQHWALDLYADSRGTEIGIAGTNVTPSPLETACANTYYGAAACNYFGQPYFDIYGVSQASPTISSLQQFGPDGITAISEGATTTQNRIVFGAGLQFLSTDSLQLQVQTKTGGVSNFDDTTVSASSSLISDAQYFTATTTGSAFRPEISSNGSYHWQARIYDETTGEYSPWQIFGSTSSATDFTINTVPLYTQKGSPFPSWEATDAETGWDADQYDNGSFECVSGNPDSTIIGYCGCAITSVAMWLQYYGIATDTDGNPVNPANLNTWLENPDNVGYDPDTGNLYWSSITGYASSTDGGAIVYDATASALAGTTWASTTPYINGLLASSTPDPVILTENNTPIEGTSTTEQHFLVATGFATNNGVSTYTVRDSAWYYTQYLNEATSTETASTVNNYNNEIDGIHIYYDPPQAPPVSEYHVGLPNALMLVDSKGRRTGEDPITGTTYHEIPGTSYSIIGSPTSSPQGAGELFVSNPPNGQYKLYILGGATGKYWVDMRIDDHEHRPELQRISGNIQAGSMIEYGQNYDGTNFMNSTLSLEGTASSTIDITSSPPRNLQSPFMPVPVITHPTPKIIPPTISTFVLPAWATSHITSTPVLNGIINPQND